MEQKKSTLDQFSKFKLSNENLKQVKGGLIHGRCQDGMTFTVGSYDASICDGHGGLSYAVVDMEFGY